MVKAPVEESAIVPKITKKKTREEMQLLEMASQMGYAVTPISKLRRFLAQSIASRMVNRTGEFVYQSAAFSIPNFPLTALETALPSYLLKTDLPGTKTWSLPSVTLAAVHLGPLMQEISMCAGASRALKTASERWSRVVATIYDAEITFVQVTNLDQTFVNFLYVLIDEEGEMHKPKNAKRVELSIPANVETEIRQQVLSDVAAMEAMGVPLSAGWLRSMGLLTKAAWVATLQKNTLSFAYVSTAPLAPGGKKQRKKPRHEHYFNVERIIAERQTGRLKEYLVRWEGYEPEWEAMRMEGHGQVGDPVDTWEPWTSLRNTEALLAWEDT